MTAEIGESFTIEPGDLKCAQVVRMLRRLEKYAYSLYPADSVHMLPREQLRSPSVRFVVARAQGSGTLLGCGAVVLRRDGYAEVKRMFVDERARRRGVGAGVLGALERLVRVEGLSVVRLETGPAQPEAVALYRRFGYLERGPFGDYRADPLSIFMEKILDE